MSCINYGEEFELQHKTWSDNKPLKRKFLKLFCNLKSSLVFISGNMSIKTDQPLIIFSKQFFLDLLAILSSKTIDTEILNRGCRLFE